MKKHIRKHAFMQSMLKKKKKPPILKGLGQVGRIPAGILFFGHLMDDWRVVSEQRRPANLFLALTRLNFNWIWEFRLKRNRNSLTPMTAKERTTDGSEEFSFFVLAAPAAAVSKENSLCLFIEKLMI